MFGVKPGSVRGGALFGLVIGAVLAPIIVDTNVINPSLDDDTLGVLVTFIVMFLCFGWAGYRAGNLPGDWASGAVAGASAALVSIAIGLLTFVVVDNVFLDVVSRQPEKIWGFQHSDYASIQEYINWGLAKGAIFGLPVGGLIGASMGALGVWAHRFQRLKSQYVLPPKGGRRRGGRSRRG
jgi:hypothetical protein